MALRCPTCSRVNPSEALFCHADGIALKNGRTPRADAVRLNFPFPFVFPSGRTCRSFDELALACLDEWELARSLLQHGDLTNFLSGLGRGDLAQVAREAARSADPDLGLDQLLAALPAQTLEPARLHVEPTQVNLGNLAVGQEPRFLLHLTNRGMRLITGSVTAYSVWLTLGDGEGSASKVFQFVHEAVIPVRVRGKALRAGAKPLEGRLVIESSGGESTVVVRCDVPTRPFPDGVLAGALTPRQVAEKARAQPRQAAPLFESGAVARWYQANGWTYPVQGPPGSGLGAVQQFFEALGLTTPPKVDVSEPAVFFIGDPGDRLQHSLQLSAREKRPVYAHASSDRPWLEVSRVKAGGRVADIRLAVPSVPDRPGELLHAKVSVTANGNQHFVIPVTLAVGGSARGGPAARAAAIPAANGPAEAVPVVEAVGILQARQRGAALRRLWPALLPLLVVGGGLLTAFVHDLFARREAVPGVAGPAVQRIAVHFHDREVEVLLGEGGVKPGPNSRDHNTKPAFWEPSMRFGLVMLGEPGAGGRPKRLTFEENGTTNNTCVRLDGNEWLFGERPFRRPDGTYIDDWPGRWLVRDEPLAPTSGREPRMGRRSVWVYDSQKVEVTQTVELMTGDQPESIDTCLVRYRVENKDDRPHRIGLRFLLDTYIGGNDGVPFLVPGESRLCDTQLDLRGDAVPQYIQACEREDLANPGTVARIVLKPGGGLEPPDRVTLGAWPNPRLDEVDERCRQEKTLWEVPLLPIKSLRPPDSAVTIYWDERTFPAGASREMGFAYGLGDVAGGESGGRLAVTAGGEFTPGGELTVTAYVHDPMPGQTVTLAAPAGFTPAGSAAVQTVPSLPPGAASRNSPVTWKLTAPRQQGEYTLTVTSSNGASQSHKVAIREKQLFGG